jgi:hypothetical protein
MRTRLVVALFATIVLVATMGCRDRTSSLPAPDPVPGASPLYPVARETSSRNPDVLRALVDQLPDLPQRYRRLNGEAAFDYSAVLVRRNAPGADGFRAASGVPGCTSANGLVASRMYVDQEAGAAALVLLRSANGSRPQAFDAVACLAADGTSSDRSRAFRYTYFGEDDFRDIYFLYVAATSHRVYEQVLDRFRDVSLDPLSDR